VLAFSLPAMVVAVLLLMAAINLASLGSRVVHAEIAVAAAGAGLGIGNAGKLMRVLWSGADAREPSWYRSLRLGITPLGLLLVVGLHWALPYAVLVMLAAGIAIERLRGTAAR